MLLMVLSRSKFSSIGVNMRENLYLAIYSPGNGVTGYFKTVEDPVNMPMKPFIVFI